MKLIAVVILFMAVNSYGQDTIKGSTTIYDYRNQQWIYTDSVDAHVASLPASTFKILHSLIALEYKAVADENEIIKWDGVDKTHFGVRVPAWNKDTDLKTAYKNSTVWYYVELAKRLGRGLYPGILKACDFGNGVLTEEGIDFWNYGDFAVTPVNQITFLVRLYEGRLPFSRVTMDKVKAMMISETSDVGIYREKSGLTRKNGKDIGWWVGYMESGHNLYFFATRLIKDEHDKNPDFSKARKERTRQILDKLIKQKNNGD